MLETYCLLQCITNYAIITGLMLAWIRVIVMDAMTAIAETLVRDHPCITTRATRAISIEVPRFSQAHSHHHFTWRTGLGLTIA
jgi:hypothetical protein